MAEMSKSQTLVDYNVKTKFPALPPRPSETAVSYTRATLEAPITALMGIAVDGRQPTRHSTSPRCRIRNQTGSTNRWRLPESLGSDLLGSSQAWRSVNIPYNATMLKIITAENPETTVNQDGQEPYKFRHFEDRPYTTPELKPVFQSSGTLKKRRKDERPPKTAPEKMQNRATSPLPTFVPPNARLAKPIDVFQYHSKRSASSAGPEMPTQRREHEAFLLLCKEMLRKELSYRWAV